MAKAKHIVVKAGDKIPIKGFDVLVVMAAGKAIAEPLKGAGQPNPACDTTPRKVWGPDTRGIVDNHDTNENAHGDQRSDHLWQVPHVGSRRC